MIEIKNITKKFGKKIVLDNVSMLFNTGRVYGLIGRNGSGKTTVFNIISGLIEYFDGKLLYDNKKPNIFNFNNISYVDGMLEPLNSDIVIKYLFFMARIFFIRKRVAKKKINYLITKFKMKSFLKQKIKNLSKGNQQKVKFIVAFLNPNLKYLLLDEPFDGIDVEMTEVIKNLIFERKEQLITILTTHRLELIVELCDKYYFLEDGKLNKDNYVKLANKSITVVTNGQVDIKQIDNLDCVSKLVRSGRVIFIKIYSLKDYQTLSYELLKDKNYLYHYIKFSTFNNLILQETNAFKKSEDNQRETYFCQNCQK